MPDLGFPQANPILSSSSYRRCRLHATKDGATVFGRGLFFHSSSGTTNSLPTGSCGEDVSGMLRSALETTTQRLIFLS